MPNDMPSDILTNYYAMDLKTNITYGIRLNAEGNCMAAQVMTTGIVNKNGEVRKVSDPDAAPPFEKTITAVEMSENAVKKVFTMVWPSETDWGKGVRPAVTTKDLPQDLIRAGIAAPPARPAASATTGATADAAIEEALRNIDQMIGSDSTKREIKQNISILRFNQVRQELGLAASPISCNMVFTGHEGTGKKTYAREVAKLYKALGLIKKDSVVQVKAEDMLSMFVGKAGANMQEAVGRAQGGVLFIDGAPVLSRPNSPSGGEVVSALVSALQNAQNSLIVIVAGDKEQMPKFIGSNQDLKTFFTTSVHFEDQTLPQLGQILDVTVADRYKLEPAARAYAMTLLEQEKARTQTKDFGNGNAVGSLVGKAVQQLAERLGREGKLSVDNAGLTREQLREALMTITLADMKGVSLTPKSELRKPIGFDTSEPGKAVANDMPPAPVAEPVLAKRSAKAAFRP
jgi:hypothetical protein